ncbi:hypothetical protein [Vagococcus bubulae]|uniref:Uncharacterized protein n=1 Tax=Vagococcus bubulae TaxID=1977868 RepID=A0A429ZRL9_9ENTE|nr:hypothetical protein [Vagococcus bubulae]RST96317.1 hypothetical protein CBF36_00880 [Vagococcus bubulae]
MSNVRSTLTEYVSLQLFKGTTFINGLFYFIGRIPFIGKIIPVRMVYADYPLKKVFTYIKFAISTAIKVIIGIIPFFVSSFLANVVFKESQLSSFDIWLVVFAFYLPIFGSLFSVPDKKDVLFITNFRINKSSHLKRMTLLELCFDLIIVTIVLIVMSLFNSLPIILTTLLGSSAYVFFSMIWLRIDLPLTLQKHPWIKKVAILVVMLALVIGFCFTMLSSFMRFLFSNPLVIIGLIIFNCLASWLVAKNYLSYPRFSLVADKKVSSSMYAFEADDKELKNKTTNFTEGVGLTKKMSIDEQANFDDLSGNAYLNALFFSRFKKGLGKGLLIKVISISVLGLALVVASQFFPLMSGVGELEKFMYRLVPSLFFVLYLTSVGKSVVQSLFMNCDISMLSFPFYRTKEAIISGFLARFKKILFYNSIVNGVLLVWLILFNLLVVGLNSIHLIGLALLVIISLTLLFSFHELFVYYLLQPFTSDFQVINPIYKVVNGVFYLFAYMNLQLKTTGLYYALGLSIVSLLYVGIGFFVILKVAPKTFKLKK